MNMINSKLPSGWVVNENHATLINLRDTLSKLIASYNNSLTGLPDEKFIEISLSDEKGSIVGGLAGRTSLGVLLLIYSIFLKC